MARNSHLILVFGVITSQVFISCKSVNRTRPILHNSLIALEESLKNAAVNVTREILQSNITNEEDFIIADRAQFAVNALQRWPTSTQNSLGHDRDRQPLPDGSRPRPRPGPPSLPQIDYTDRFQMQHFNHDPPMINVTAEDSKQKMINLTWEAGETWTATSLSTRTLRQLSLFFKCTASYPIEWLSEKSFGAKTWTMDEYRDFDKFFPNSVTPATYRIELKLFYEQINSLPGRLEIFCGSPRKSVSIQKKMSKIEMTKGHNSTHKFQVFRDIFQDVGQEIVQYSDGLGANIDCHLDLIFVEHENMFACATDVPNGNLTMDYKEDSCYDHASCERRWSQNTCWPAEAWSNSGTKSNKVGDMWEQGSPPASGIIYCETEGPHGHVDNKTAALPFFHSLSHVCPDEDPSTRLRLYVNSGTPDRDTLIRDFVSFCEVPGFVHANDTGSEVRAFFVGDNITVTCVASSYHFAYGTRIRYLSSHGTLSELAVLANDNGDVDRGTGTYKYTAKVFIKHSDISGLLCETFLKQSVDYVQKSIRFNVKLPRNITFKETEGVNTQLEVYPYTGESELQLRCECDSDPPAKLSWRKQRKSILEVSNLLKVVSESASVSILVFPELLSSGNRHSLASELAGQYICEAKNRLERNEKIYNVAQPNDNGTIQFVAPPTKSPTDQEGGTAWYVWAIVVTIFLIVVIAVIGLLVWKIKRQSQELRLLSKAEVDEFIFGKPEFLQHHSSTEEVNNYAPYLPYNKGYEITKEQLEIEENAVLGSGAYAIVLRGTVHRNGDRTKVAIKTAKPMDDISYFKALLSELKIMGFIGTHANIVNLVGAHTKNIQNREIYIAIEYCQNGNLLEYLRDNRQYFKNLISPEGTIIEDSDAINDSFVNPVRESLSTITLMKWSQEVASGMEFLSQKKVIHGDLAARNILLNDHLVAKIGDFGLSRQLFEYANYIKKQQSPLPWKWLALECLQDMRFSVKSDVWAYSILLYEVFSLGRVPYPGHSYNDEFLEALVGGKRPSKPLHATNDVFEIMSSCWKEDPEERPNFAGIREYFKKKLSTLIPQEYLDLHEKVTNSTPLPSEHITTVEVHAGPSSARAIEVSHGSSLGKTLRFSFNAKTITAAFHRH